MRAGIESAVEIDRRDQRFAGVGQQRLLAAAAGLLFAAAENHVLAEPELLRHFRERRGRDQVGLDLRLLPFVVGRERAEQRFGDDQAEHGVAEELQRLVVGHAAAGILVRLRLVRQRVLEQPAILEAIADARFERIELLRQRHDDAAADLLAMAVDDPHRVGGILVAHGDAGLAHRTEPELEQARRRPGGAHRLQAVTVEQRLDDVGFDL